MFAIVEKRRWFLGISGVIIFIALGLMLYTALTTGSAFRLGIDFVGGSIYEFAFTESGADEDAIRGIFSEFGDDNVTIQRLGQEEDYNWSVRGVFQEQEVTDAILSQLNELAPIDNDRVRIEVVSETIGSEVAQAAFWAILIAGLIVTGFIVIAFRQVPNAIRYGVCAIAAMVHDIVILMGITALFGILFGWEIDALFLTALLTIVGFSVQDSIVLFDRIRENIPKHLGEPFETIVNRSIWETIHRSLATQLNAFFIMAAILLFGGDTIKQFIAILFIGLVLGTYSSIFIAAPLLVAWEKGEIPLLGSNEEGELRTANADI